MIFSCFFSAARESPRAVFELAQRFFVVFVFCNGAPTRTQVLKQLPHHQVAHPPLFSNPGILGLSPGTALAS